MQKYLTEIKYDWPKAALLQEFNSAIDKFVLAGYPGNQCPGMYVGAPTRFIKNEVNKFIGHFKIPYKYHVGLLAIYPDTTIPWHVDTPDSVESGDYALLCAINFILDPDNSEPVEFKDGSENIYKYYYRTALLNIKEQHRVVNGSILRKIIRIFFITKDATYENVRQIFNTHSL